MGSPTRADLEAAARAHFDVLAANIDQPRRFAASDAHEGAGWNVHLSEQRIDELDAQLKANDFDREVERVAVQMLARLGVTDPDLDSVQGVHAQQLAARAVRQQMAYLIHQLTKPATRFVPDDQAFLGPVGAEACLADVPTQAPVPLPGPTLAEATSLFLKGMERRRLGDSQRNEHARLFEWLKQELGPERWIGSVTRDDLKGFRDNLQRIDVTLRGRPGSFRDRLTDDPTKQPKSATYLRYWNSTKALFAWCASELHDGPDPTAGLTIDKRKGETKNTPPPFTKEELIKLFQTPLYAGYQSRKRVREPGDVHVREGHWWAAILLLYTGLRAGEFSQLLPEDFHFDDAVPHLKVREENGVGEKVKSAKNASSVRDVPLHPNLLTLGLREFVTARSKRFPRQRVFQEFRVSGRGRWSDGMTRFWRDYLQHVGLWEGGRATHVFRHSLVACLRANGVAEEDVAAFVGHTRGTITSAYGGAYPLGRKAKAALLLDYGFDVIAQLGGGYDPKRHSV